MNKRQRKKAEKRTIHYISELRKTDKQAWHETLLRRRRHAMVYFFRRDTDAIRQIRHYNLLVYEMTEDQYWTYFIKHKRAPILCQHRRRWLIDQFSLPYDIRIPSSPNGYLGQRPKVDLVNMDPLAKVAQKVAQAFKNLAKRASETISEIFQR